MLEEHSVLAQRYQIVKTLGEGGMGSVYKATDLELDRMVALKVIRPELARDPAIIDRFKQELLLSQRVTHRNVIRIYDLGEGDGVKFITMEYIEGDDLRSLIDEVLQADKIYINVGGRVSVPDMPGVHEVPFLNNSSMMDIA